ncbi:MAG: ribonuclease III [Candidatus Riflebacteria bacterium]|nr:ribonuclease III [Candidatus Riflebacteria bacterium]
MRFQDLEFLEEALTHRSSPSVARGGPDNERLEFLGDAVLELVVSDLLFRKTERQDEGRLTQVRSLLVNQEVLARISRRLGIPRHLRLGRGEAREGGSMKASLNANALEAVLGAIYLDSGFEAAYKVIRRIFTRRLRTALERTHAKCPKSLLQELSLARYNSLPRYVTVRETGSDHARKFHVKVVLQNQHEFRGSGKSKKAAEKQAAAVALKRLSTTPSR